MPQAEPVSTTFDPFALGGRRSETTIAKLWVQRQALWAMPHDIDDEEGRKLSFLLKTIEDTIASSPAETPQDIVVKLMLLEALGTDNEWDGTFSDICRTCREDVERLFPAAPPRRVELSPAEEYEASLRAYVISHPRMTFLIDPDEQARLDSFEHCKDCGDGDGRWDCAWCGKCLDRHIRRL